MQISSSISFSYINYILTYIHCIFLFNILKQSPKYKSHPKVNLEAGENHPSNSSKVEPAYLGRKFMVNIRHL